MAQQTDTATVSRAPIGFIRPPISRSPPPAREGDGNLDGGSRLRGCAGGLALAHALGAAVLRAEGAAPVARLGPGLGPGSYDPEFLYGNLNKPTFNMSIADAFWHHMLWRAAEPLNCNPRGHARSGLARKR